MAERLGQKKSEEGTPGMTEFERLTKQLDPKKMPQHVGIIMDGNGRWAKQHLVQRLSGHLKGREVVRDIVVASDDIGLKCLTIYAFSTENWRRSTLEVKGLLKLNMESIKSNIDELHGNNIQVRYLGSKTRLDPDYERKMNEVCKKTWKNTGLKFNIAFNYGGRQEIVEAVNEIVSESPGTQITEEMIADHLYSKGLPDPDLIIRTSGELRLSNFLLWQSAYSELWFTSTLWPDFTRVDFVNAILDFQKRNRKFGAVK